MSWFAAGPHNPALDGNAKLHLIYRKSPGPWHCFVSVCQMRLLQYWFRTMMTDLPFAAARVEDSPIDLDQIEDGNIFADEISDEAVEAAASGPMVTLTLSVVLLVKLLLAISGLYTFRNTCTS
jgi:hypothetical protein